MSWRYAAVRDTPLLCKDGAIYYGWTIREIYFMDLKSEQSGEPDGWSDAQKPFGDTKEELIECLKMMLQDCEKQVYQVNEDGTVTKLG